MPKTNSKDTNRTIYDVMGLDYDDPKRDELVSRLSVNQMAQFCMDGGWGTMEINDILKPYCTHRIFFISVLYSISERLSGVI